VGAAPGSGQILVWHKGTAKIVLPFPKDSALDLEGECWGWHGGNLSKLGNFTHSLSIHNWDGSKQSIKNENFIISFTVDPLGSLGAKGTYSTNTNPTVAIPYNLRLLGTGAPGASYQTDGFSLTWDWDGDEKDITGFTFFVNGSPAYHKVSPNKRSFYFLAPDNCGADYQFQVAADTDDARSPLSQPLKHQLPPCQYYAEVQFLSISIIGQVWDTQYIFPMDKVAEYYPCHGFQAYFEIGALGAEAEVREHGGGNFFIHMNCNHKWSPPNQSYAFSWYLDDTITVPINQKNPFLSYWTIFWDHDITNDDDLIAHYSKTIKDKTLEEWDGYEEIFEFSQGGEGFEAFTRLRVKVRGFKGP
jgi:hypothetical protein